MDDNDVCPLCCEELDISDQQFFPCKCGYQVCMWCWHRIKESESGLCPACRTPYGDDPHEFSAVDMEEVVKANKEKAAAEKREKERLRQQQAAAAGVSAFGVGGMHIGGGSDGDLAVATAGGSRGHLDPPKDRNQLANMRVIRRNLVYAVGLPPSIATEEILKKPEYFGQNGKISKIVINRNHNGNGDPRRASASAYVTFAHKDDALACILALDGFYVDGRNIRASYGTSKYCSAFIKNVRCNNPDCTYLHVMGDSEDTFSKQEIQAGYVTSGRDVLARQQQIAAATAGSGSRRRVGNGGPSGSGKVPSNPVFPPPTYDEPSKPSQTNLVPPPPPATSSTTQFPPVSSASVQRSSSTGIAGFSAVAAGNGVTSSTGGLSKLARSSSAPLTGNADSAQKTPALTPAEMLSRQQEELRKRHPQNSTNTNNKQTTPATSTTQPANILQNGIERPAAVTAAPPSTTAASIVAGVHSTSKSGPSQSAPRTTLTALTPLKRASSLPEKREQTILSKTGNVGNITSSDPISLSQNIPISKGLPARKESLISRDTTIKLSTLRSNSTTLANDAVAVSSNSVPIPSMKAPVNNTPVGVGSIGGMVIGGTSGPPISAPSKSFSNQNSSSSLGSIGSMNGSFLGSIGPSNGIENRNVIGDSIGGFGGNGSSAIGGNNILSQQLMPGNSDKDDWILGESKANANSSDGLFGGSDFGSIGGTGLWDNAPSYHPGTPQRNNNNMGGMLPGGKSSSLPGRETQLGNPNLPRDNVSGSSALASMLGIELPTGVGSLRETLWASSTPLKAPSSEVRTNAPTPIGAGIKKSHDGVIIGGHSSMHSSAGSVPIGGFGLSAGAPNGGNKNDIALLQSLLPGVHITSGNAYQPAASNGRHGTIGGSEWGGLNNNAQQNQMLVGGLMPNHQHQQNEGWNNGNSGFGYPSAPGSQKQNKSRKQNQPNIW